MQTLTATQARATLFHLIKNSIRKNSLFQIHHPQGNAILMSEEEYESMVETIELLTAPNFRKKFRQARNQIKTGKVVPMEAVFKK
jgi:antitoxin YefM